MARYQKTGVLEVGVEKTPQYGDVSNLDFQECMQFVVDARARFDALPSSVRERFHNDPGAFLDFMEDPDNGAEAVKLGLREAPKAPVVPEAPKGAVIAPGAVVAAPEGGPKP